MAARMWAIQVSLFVFCSLVCMEGLSASIQIRDVDPGQNPVDSGGAEAAEDAPSRIILKAC